MKIIREMHMKATQDGDGVAISRVSDFSGLSLDPFLMVDELKSDDEADYMGGFPPHPHRGLETFTYMIKGGFEHRDQLGNKKKITAGNVQWMSTGFGVVHAEMPMVDTDGMHGFQIWVNMPAKDKLRPAIYADSIEGGLPQISNLSGATLKALAGTWQFADQESTDTAQSPIPALSGDASIADVSLDSGGKAIIDRSAHNQAFVYVHTGEVAGYSAGQLLLLDSAQPLELSSVNGGEALVFSGRKIGEKIAHYGPFVMNTMEEINQAITDYNAGKFGSIGA
jgi:hypothetical protein